MKKIIWNLSIYVAFIILTTTLTFAQANILSEAKIGFNSENKKIELNFFKEGKPIASDELNYEFKKDKKTFSKNEVFTIKSKKDNFEVRINSPESVFKELQDMSIKEAGGKKYLIINFNRDLNLGLEKGNELQIPLLEGQKVEINHFGEGGVNINIGLPKGKIRTIFGGLLNAEELSEKEKEKVKFETIPLTYMIEFFDQFGGLNSQKEIKKIATRHSEKSKFLLDKTGVSYITSFGFRLSKSKGNILFYESSKGLRDVEFTLPQKKKEELLNRITVPEGIFSINLIEDKKIIPISKAPKGTKVLLYQDMGIFPDQIVFFQNNKEEYLRALRIIKNQNTQLRSA